MMYKKNSTWLGFVERRMEKDLLTKTTPIENLWLRRHLAVMGTLWGEKKAYSFLGSKAKQEKKLVETQME